MRRQTIKRNNTKASRRHNSQQGFIKNWVASKNTSGRQRVKLVFILGIAVIGTYLIATTMAASKPRYFGNSDYWIARIIACETGQGVWGQGDYEAKGEGSRSGAFNYSKAKWNKFGGFSEARLAPAAVQNDKFASDWNDPNIGNKQWERSKECWKPAGTIKGAPCLPVPKNPTKEEIQEFQAEPVIDEENKDFDTDAGLCCGPGTEFNAPEGYELE